MLVTLDACNDLPLRAHLRKLGNPRVVASKGERLRECARFLLLLLEARELCFLLFTHVAQPLRSLLQGHLRLTLLLLLVRDYLLLTLSKHARHLCPHPCILAFQTLDLHPQMLTLLLLVLSELGLENSLLHGRPLDEIFLQQLLAHLSGTRLLGLARSFILVAPLARRAFEFGPFGLVLGVLLCEQDEVPHSRGLVFLSNLADRDPQFLPRQQLSLLLLLCLRHVPPELTGDLGCLLARLLLFFQARTILLLLFIEETFVFPSLHIGHPSLPPVEAHKRTEGPRLQNQPVVPAWDPRKGWIIVDLI